MIFKFYSFFDENISKQTEWSQMGRRVMRRHIWSYSVCLYPIKGTTGLYELRSPESLMHSVSSEILDKE